MACFELVSGSDCGRIYRLDEARLTLGRSEALCDLSQPFLGDRNVSRRHAQIERAAAGFSIRDMGSRNGTWVNGEKLTLPRPIADRDRILEDLEGFTGTSRATIAVSCAFSGLRPDLPHGAHR